MILFYHFIMRTLVKTPLIVEKECGHVDNSRNIAIRANFNFVSRHKREKSWTIIDNWRIVGESSIKYNLRTTVEVNGSYKLLECFVSKKLYNGHRQEAMMKHDGRLIINLYEHIVDVYTSELI